MSRTAHVKLPCNEASLLVAAQEGPTLSDVEIELPPLHSTPSTPLWLQVKHALRDLITFRLRSGDRIPSETEIGRIYDVSRVTVRQAVSSLVDEGMLQKQQGRGTFVLAQRLAEPLTDPVHFLSSGFDAVDPEHIRVFSAETVDAPDWITAKLGLRPGEDVHKIRKLLEFDDEPAAFRTSFIPVRVAPDLLAMDLSRPLHALVAGVHAAEPSEAYESIEFIVADGFRADMLKVRVSHPLILVERLVYGGSGEALECSRAYYRADRFRFQHRLKRGA